MAKYLKWFLITLSVVMCIGGAVNDGMTYFAMAIPFMIVLLNTTFHRDKRVFTGTLIFILACIATSLTQDKNPLLYPIIKSGEVTVLQDGYYVSYASGSGGFYDYEGLKFLLHRNPAELERIQSFAEDNNTKTIQSSHNLDISQKTPFTLTKLQKGEKIAVTAVEHTSYDFGTEVALVTTLGLFGRSDYEKVGNNPGPFVEPNKEVQPEWVWYLGLLMMYPFLFLNPIAIISFLVPVALVWAITIVISKRIKTKKVGSVTQK